MRRSDREITDKSEIVKIIVKCEVCRIALVDGEIPYVVPMNYGFSYIDEKLVLYFHGAGEGKKHNIISKNPNACFVIDCSHKLIEAAEAAHYSMEYECVIGTGRISYITEKSEKTIALSRLMVQYVKDKDFAFTDNVLESVTVFKLEVSEFTGKRLTKDIN